MGFSSIENFYKRLIEEKLEHYSFKFYTEHDRKLVCEYGDEQIEQNF